MKPTNSTDDFSHRWEEIVAYLDGELSPAESAQVEQQLAADEQYRRQLQGLQRTWQALDELPAVSVDDNFAKTTMEMVVDVARSDIDAQTLALPIQRRKKRLSTFLLTTASLLLGVLVYRLAWENPNDALLANLPVVQYIDVYSQFRDVEFLRLLSHVLASKNWPNDLESEELQQRVKQFQLVATPESRHQWLNDLPPDDRIALKAKANRFRALSEKQQANLRELQETVAISPDAVELQKTMLQYQHWLNGLPPSEQFELRELSVNDRVHRISRMIDQQTLMDSLELSPEELDTFLRTVRPRLNGLKEEMIQNMSPGERRAFENAPPERKGWHLIRKFGTSSPTHREQLHRIIRDALPDSKREQFEKLSPGEQRERFFGWMQQAMWSEASNRRPGQRRRRIEPTEEQLEEFFVEEVDAATKERLLALPRDEMQQQLLRMIRRNLPVWDWQPHGSQHTRPFSDRPPLSAEFDRRGRGPGPRRHDRRNGSRSDHPPERPRFPPPHPDDR